PSSKTGSAARSGGPLAALDRWMAAHPWHPRVAPMLAYLALLGVAGLVRDRGGGHAWGPRGYLALYVLMCLVPAWLLWRYRALVPEVNWRPHWLALPAGVAVIAVWIALGRWLGAALPG